MLLVTRLYDQNKRNKLVIHARTDQTRSFTQVHGICSFGKTLMVSNVATVELVSRLSGDCVVLRVRSLRTPSVPVLASKLKALEKLKYLLKNAVNNVLFPRQNKGMV